MAKKFNSKEDPTAEVQSAAEGLGTVPPQAIELEEAVLGALMLEKDSISTVQEYIKPESFYKESHRIIYKAIIELSIALEPIDLYSVTERLRREKQLKAAGGMTYLAQLTQKVGSAAHIEYHAKIIAQKYVQRELIRSATEIQRRSFDESSDVNDLIDFAEGEIFKVAEGHIKRDVQKSADVLKKTMKIIEAAAANKSSISGVPTGFRDLDKLTLGWQVSDLVILAGRPSMGKTAFVLTMARNIALEHNQAIAFFSLEMDARQLMMRLIVGESGLDSKDLRGGRLTGEQWAHLDRSIDPLSKAPLFIDDTPSISIFEFRSKARRLKTQYDIKLIIIDYLQLMTSNIETRGNREQEVAFISRSLKAIAKELELPIIALSQLNRSAVTGGDSRKPRLSDLRESGSIEQDADIVAFIHRPEFLGLTVDENGQSLAGRAELIVAKHRNGATDTIKLRFLKDQAKFVDDDSQEPRLESYNTIESAMNNDNDGYQDSFISGAMDNFNAEDSFSTDFGGSFEDENSPF